MLHAAVRAVLRRLWAFEPRVGVPAFHPDKQTLAGKPDVVVTTTKWFGLIPETIIDGAISAI
jgi:hypothetical protein